MRILWISSLAFQSNNEFNYPVKGSGAVSGSAYQGALIGGLSRLGVSVDIIAEYPYLNRAFHLSKKFSHNENGEGVYLPHFPFFNRFIKTLFINKAVKKRLKKHKYDFVVCYLIHTPYLKGIKTAKKIDKNIRSVLLCPDLPEYGDCSLYKKPIKKLLKKIDYLKIDKLYKSVDSFSLFSSLMADKLPVKYKPCTVIEGISSVEKLFLAKVKKEKAIMYAGSLQEGFGIENTIKALEYLPQDYSLWIFGDGALSGFIKEQAKLNERIKFFGFRPREEVFSYLQRASCLVIARDNKKEYTNYSFPSKIYEYLYSGTPVVITKLQGISEEYSKYLFYIEDNEPKTIASKITEVISDKLNFGEDRIKSAREFVFSKNGFNQAKKFYDFLEKVVKEYSKIRVMHYYTYPENSGGPLTYINSICESERLVDKVIFAKCFQNKKASEIERKDKKRILNEIGNFNPDIMHVHGVQSEGYLGIKFSLKSKVKSLMTVHGLQIDDEKSGKIKRFLSKYYIEPYALRKSDAVYCVSKETEKRDIIEKYAKNLLPTIYNFVPDSFINRESTLNVEDCNNQDKKIISVIGRVSLDKGMAEIENIIKKTDSSVCFYIVGEGEYLSTMKNNLSSEEKKGKVKFFGYQKDVKPFLLKTDIFLFLSHHENMSLSLLEALSLGCAVIATDVGGNKEIVKNGENGILVAVGNEKEALVALKVILNDEKCAINLKENAVKTVKEKFSEEIFMEKLYKTYKNLSNKGK